MNRYMGVKQVNATPMTREEYNELRGWRVPADENPDDPVYLVEYVDGGKANTEQFNGYVSWGPADVFEKSYRLIGAGMTFGMALDILKSGGRVARLGWNGKGMWLSLSGPLEGRRIGNESFWSSNNARYAAEQPDCAALVLPCITMKTVDSSGREGILMGWLASQTDMLAEDWVVIP